MKALLILGAVLLVGAVGHADEDYSGNVGGTFGLSVPDYSGSTSRTIYGAEGTAKLGSEYGIGAYYMNSAKNETISSIPTDFNYQLYGVRATYHFEGEAKGVFFGAEVGISKVHIGTAAVNTSVDTSPTHFGAVAGYDKMLGSMFSLGGEFDYIAVGSSSGSTNGVTTNINSFNTLNFQVALKFWF